MAKIFSKIVYANDAVNICYEASKSCYASPLSYNYETRQKYIAARVKEGHSSITEHSNIILLIRIPKKHVDVLADFLADVVFLHTCLKKSDKSYYLLIGGSALGFNHTIEHIQNQFNPILMKIKESLYECVPSCFFKNLTNTHMMREEGFVEKETSSLYHMKRVGDIETDNKDSLCSYRHTIPSVDKTRIEFVNVDPVKDIYDVVKDFGFTILDITEFCTVSVKFKGMSRIITQQLTRHRNAITQESQRYVNASDAAFNSPALFKPDKYDDTTLVDIVFGSAGKQPFTLSELGKAISAIYPQLINQGLAKEDARAYLPGNIQSNLYVSFTIKNLFHFLSLRLDKHAQAEIRLYAKVIAESLFSVDPFRTVFNVDSYMNSDIIDNVIECVDEYLIPKAMYSEIYDNQEITDISEEGIGDPVESVEKINASAEPAVGEELPKFGMEGSVPMPMKDSDAEEIYKTYNPEQYAATRDESKN